MLEQGEYPPMNFSTKEREQFLTLLQTCNYETLTDTMSNLPNATVDYFRIIREMSAPLNKQIMNCKWFGITDESCEDLLTETYTEDGLCYTFNGFNGTDIYRENTIQYEQGLESFVNASSTGRINRTLTWSLYQGYPENEPLKTYPARVVSASTRAAFEAYQLIDTSQPDYTCSGVTQGFKMMIHTPDDVPSQSRGFVRISPNNDITITIKPIMVTTSDGIAQYPAEKRKCFMNDERYLEFFKVYSEKNCEIECLTNYTLRECGCVKFSMPRTRDMPVCGADKIACYLNAENRMLQEYFFESPTDSNSCNCMPSCTSLEYDTEISQSDIDVNKIMDILVDDFPDYYKFSRIIVHFKSNEFITSKRSELYGFSDFLANCGGVLGLFTGFSILSLIEILYHVTLRLWSNMNR